MKVGVIGAGAISDIYLQNMIGKFDNLEVLSIAATHLDHAQHKGDMYGLRACTVDEMLADPEIELVVNLTPAAVHYELNKKALLAGKHVYTEKVMTDNPETAEELVRLADEKGFTLALHLTPSWALHGRPPKKQSKTDSLAKLLLFQPRPIDATMCF